MRLVLLLLAAVPVAAETVRFTTLDDVAIAGEFHAAVGDAPTVICFGDARGGFAPLVEPLRERGMNVLLLDLRGFGESAPELAAKAKARDAALFSAMYQDVQAAVRFLEETGRDPTRIALAAAGDGCHVALDYAVRSFPWCPVRAGVFLAPGRRIRGVRTAKWIDEWPGTRALVLWPEGAREIARPFADGLKRRGGTGSEVLGAEAGAGAAMLGGVDGVAARIAGFLQDSLVKEVDLAVRRVRRPDLDPKFPPRVALRHMPRGSDLTGNPLSLLAWVDDGRLYVGLSTSGVRGTLRCEIGGRALDLPPTGLFDRAWPEGRAAHVLADGTEQPVFRGWQGVWVACDVGPPAPFRLIFTPEGREPIAFPGGEAPFVPRAVPP